MLKMKYRMGTIHTDTDKDFDLQPGPQTAEIAIELASRRLPK